ncbi:hypothetical protein [Pseudooceanicola sp. HF7]|uniref:hypothetical protein n=1 Tax=Pseudooceanicola sp. HF7 TaxID=2721560 RepID=UPI00142FECA5|nr:hypothetical protein [Pseudooceanicola sp. HF7]NIZ08340.1 hypothetical protein [Pseudooceanicola sp. HF7]
MPLQLLLRYDSFDRDAHETGTEGRANAGLSQLQLWKEGSGTHWALFSVANRAKAQDWVDKAEALGQAPTDHHFLETL